MVFLQPNLGEKPYYPDFQAFITETSYQLFMDFFTIILPKKL